MTENHFFGLEEETWRWGRMNQKGVGGWGVGVSTQVNLMHIYIIFHLKFNDSSMQKNNSKIKSVSRALRSLVDGYQINDALMENNNM